MSPTLCALLFFYGFSIGYAARWAKTTCLRLHFTRRPGSMVLGATWTGGTAFASWSPRPWGRKERRTYTSRNLAGSVFRYAFIGRWTLAWVHYTPTRSQVREAGPQVLQPMSIEQQNRHERGALALASSEDVAKITLFNLPLLSYSKEAIAATLVWMIRRAEAIRSDLTTLSSFQRRKP